MKHVLTIAGSDCIGGAGIQADLKTFSAHGVYGMSVIVSVVAENTFHVTAVENVSPKMVAAQIDAVFEDIDVHAVKIGMLSCPPTMQTVAEKLRQYRPPHIVIDPVMYAKNGFALMPPDAVAVLTEQIVPLADLLTPNIPEAEALAGMQIMTVNDMEAAAEKITALGACSVLIKGGQRIENAIDLFYDGTAFHRFPSERIDTPNTHGTGCTYSSAIAANLANGRPMIEAIANAKAYVTTAIRNALDIGKGCGPTHHFVDLYRHGLQKENP
jgi:hydroxymethylpyrimidine/phosphomethylpyrimidine kinase